MVYAKRFIVAWLVLLANGCCSLNRDARKEAEYAQGYRKGVRENIAAFAGQFTGNDFPYFYWSSPVVQNVRIPAHIRNGLFVPEHTEPVVIEPAEWRKTFTYPVNTPQGKQEPEHQKGGITYEVERFNFDLGRDITVLPDTGAGLKPGSQNQDSR